MKVVNTRFLLLVGGLGGLLCGIDFGIIAVSIPYIRALKLYTDLQVGWIVGGVMLGGIVGSATGGVLCDRIGRKTVISLAAALFLASVPTICLSGTSFSAIMTGRLLQGMSCGYMSIAMPMYLAEVLTPESRGRGTAIFQLFLGIGLVLAAVSGVVIARTLGAADAPADIVSDAAKSLAWRVNFWWTLAPVALLFACSLVAPESPVWFKKVVSSRFKVQSAHGASKDLKPETLNLKPETLFRRKYVLPFVLALAVLTLNKLIGFGCVVPYAVVLFQKAGLSGALGNGGDLALKAVNLAVTLLVVGLVDKKGRTWLLRIGTAGLSVSLAAIGVLFVALERGWLQPSVIVGVIVLAAFLSLMFFYAFGPGVCVWLVLSELMPARIRANGMAIALFSNQFVAWGLAVAFLPLTNALGFGSVFLAFALMGVVYFVTVLFIPETKGKTLEEIEEIWSKGK